MKSRKTPTQKQIENLKNLDDDSLVKKAIESMHSLNRRAKKIRDNKNMYWRANFASALNDELYNIYNLKNQLMIVLVRKNKAEIMKFIHIDQEWYLINCGDFSFHQPEQYVPEDLKFIAKNIKPHDPNQLQKEIPNVGLTIEAQKECVKLAIERLYGFKNIGE
jgi:hypothetical protein